MSKTADNLIESHANDDDKKGHDSNKSAIGNAGQFIQDTRGELKRVSWPSANDVKNTTIIVIVNVIFFALFLFLVDQAWTYILHGIEWLARKIFGVA